MVKEQKITTEMIEFRKRLRGLELDKTIKTFGPLEEALGKEAVLVQVSYTLQDAQGRKMEITDRGKRYIDMSKGDLMAEKTAFESEEFDERDVDYPFN